MYEAKQNKEKISRRIDEEGRVQQNLKDYIIRCQNLKTLACQCIKIKELNDPIIGKGLASKHLYETQYINKMKPNDTLDNKKHNAKQIGKIVGRRPSDGRKTPNTILNINSAKLRDDLKSLYDDKEVECQKNYLTKQYDTATAMAHDTVMAFGGVYKKKANIWILNNKFDHLDSTAPSSPMNPKELAKETQYGFMLTMKENQYEWNKIQNAYKEGVTEGENVASNIQNNYQNLQSKP